MGRPRPPARLRDLRDGRRVAAALRRLLPRGPRRTRRDRGLRGDDVDVDERGSDIEHPEDEALLSQNVAAAASTRRNAALKRKISNMEFPMLALTPDQFAMIDALDNVGIKKYPVHIHEARHSHAAIIVRMQRDTFREGKIVVRHWLSNFEL